MFRSEDMQMVRVYISPDVVRETLEELGAKSLLHFIPAGGGGENNHEKQAQLAQLLTQADFLLRELKQHGMRPVKLAHGFVPDLETVSAEISKHYYRIVQLTQIKKETAQKAQMLREDVVVLQELQKVMEESIQGSDFGLDTVSEVGLEYVAGVISKGQVQTLEQFLWRSLHGNLYFIQVEMGAENTGRTPGGSGIDSGVSDSSPALSSRASPAGFICFTHGERAIERIRNICSKVGARIIRYDNKKQHKKQADLMSVSATLSQVSVVHRANTDALQHELLVVRREVLPWQYCISREMAIEQARSTLQGSTEDSCLIAHGFIRARDEEKFRRVIARICEVHGDAAAEKIEVPSDVVTPTYFSTNKLTAAFQDLTDVYGVPRYKEINPTLFTITTFPFLFGVMFGDVGHGILLLLLSLWMIRKESVMEIPSFFELIFHGRYVMVLMGAWSVYFGFLYMDFFGAPFGESLSASVRGTCWFGIDHIWHVAKNGSAFINSLKMKSSLVIGFCHLLLGMVLSGMNAVYRGDRVRLFCVVIPQFAVFLSLVGYMVGMIILKWVTPDERWPSIISLVIEMISFSAPASDFMVFSGHVFLQRILMSIIIASVPVMIIAPPSFQIISGRKRSRQGAAERKQTEEKGGAAEEKSEEDLLEIWMHSVIETVEFLMGLISNISSYLRLWAVSLAHAELSGILYSKTIGNTDAGTAYRCISSVFWALGTVTLLLALEGLSATLHSLRLHWVEFGSKFYAGGGVKFAPLSFAPASLMNRDSE